MIDIRQQTSTTIMLESLLAAGMSVSPELMKSVSSMMSSMSPEMMQSMMAMASSSGAAPGVPATAAGPSGQQFAPGKDSYCYISMPTPNILGLDVGELHLH